MVTLWQLFHNEYFNQVSTTSVANTFQEDDPCQKMLICREYPHHLPPPEHDFKKAPALASHYFISTAATRSVTVQNRSFHKLTK